MGVEAISGYLRNEKHFSAFLVFPSAARALWKRAETHAHLAEAWGVGSLKG